MTAALVTPGPHDVYPAAITVAEMFVDPTYQRDVDRPRARRLADNWEPRLIGALEVSDRGAGHQPRYAIIDGQHRYAAAKLRDPATVLVANVHSGLTVADEAILFDKLNRQRKQTSTGTTGKRAVPPATKPSWPSNTLPGATT